MQRWFVSRCSLFGFASLVDFVFIPLLLSLSFSPCVFHLSPIHKYTYTYTDYTPYNNLNAHIFSHNSSYISLSHSFSPAPFSIHNTQIARIHPKFYRFIFSLMCICLFLVKWNFFVLCSIAYLLFAHLSLFVCLISHYSQFLYVSLSVFSFFSIVFNLYMCFLHLS